MRRSDSSPVRSVVGQAWAREKMLEEQHTGALADAKRSAEKADLAQQQMQQALAAQLEAQKVAATLASERKLKLASDQLLLTVGHAHRTRPRNCWTVAHNRVRP